MIRRGLNVQLAVLMAAILAGLVVLYILQIFTPLRFNTDAVRFLAMADSANQGHGFLVQGESDQYPIAYPLLIVM